MTNEYIDFGVSLDTQKPEALLIDAAKQTFYAAHEHHDFQVIDIRKAEKSEIVVVDCTCDGVPTRNKIGIRYRERLALRFFDDPESIPEIRALRSDFPITFHQNTVLPGEPRAICIYFEPWTAVQRAWTPQKHLARIQWWLENMANGTLHAEDQPLEPLYFDTMYKLILPLDFTDKLDDSTLRLIALPRFFDKDNFKILIGHFIKHEEAGKHQDLPFSCIAVSLPSIVHGQIETTPGNLGDLHDQLFNRGVNFEELLFQTIQSKAESSGLPKTKEQFGLLILNVPLKRSDDSGIEKTQQKGFLLHENVAQLGEKAGVLWENNDKYWKVGQVGEGSPVTNSDWRDVVVEPMEIGSPLTRKLSRTFTGINEEGPTGVLAGVGALGSALANIWYRQGWGTWTLIDHDILETHNLARHAAYEVHVGTYKADAVLNLEDNIYPAEKSGAKAVSDRVNNFSNDKVTAALDTVELVVDATTTLEAPRDLSLREEINRAASVFITPSGLDSVLLLEDSDRRVRLDVLEAQYYRALINNDWGKTHLVGHQGKLWVGAGCRDISAIISNEQIVLHSATISRQLRREYSEQTPKINVWQSDPVTGALQAYSVKYELPIVIEHDDLTVIWDEGVKRKVRQLRQENLPNETGGVLLGYFDMTLSRVYVVDALPAPDDSQGDKTGFSRGVEGLQENVQSAQELTANVVGYIGEWHSHPPGCGANPSVADVFLLANLASELYRDGFPALMLIVGEENEKWIIGKTVDEM